jgi:hypothetical protein
MSTAIVTNSSIGTQQFLYAPLLLLLKRLKYLDVFVGGLFGVYRSSFNRMIDALGLRKPFIRDYR